MVELKENTILPNSILEIDLLNDKDKKTNLRKELTESNDIQGCVIFIYPKANTPGCTKQAQLFRDKFNEFVEKKHKVYGLSADSPELQEKWKENLKLPYDLLCDEEKNLIKALGCVKGNSTARSHLIIKKDFTLVLLKKGVSPATSATETFQFITENHESVEKKTVDPPKTTKKKSTVEASENKKNEESNKKKKKTTEIKKDENVITKKKKGSVSKEDKNEKSEKLMKSTKGKKKGGESTAKVGKTFKEKNTNKKVIKKKEPKAAVSKNKKETKIESMTEQKGEKSGEKNENVKEKKEEKIGMKIKKTITKDTKIKILATDAKKASKHEIKGETKGADTAVTNKIEMIKGKKKMVKETNTDKNKVEKKTKVKKSLKKVTENNKDENTGKTGKAVKKSEEATLK